jgi:hypothetical protein
LTTVVTLLLVAAIAGFLAYPWLRPGSAEARREAARPDPRPAAEVEDEIEREIRGMRRGSEPAARVCGECGAEYPKEGRFCPYCGARLT